MTHVWKVPIYLNRHPFKLNNYLSLKVLVVYQSFIGFSILQKKFTVKQKFTVFICFARKYKLYK